MADLVRWDVPFLPVADLDAEVQQFVWDRAKEHGAKMADHRLSIQGLPKLFPQYPCVLLLHDEDGVSPTDMTFVDPDS